jgi:hypothetical protein
MEILKKLQIPSGGSIYLVNTPKGLKLDVPVSKNLAQGAVLVFADDSTTLRKNCKPAVEAAKADRLSWIAYPKAGQLKTDLNRDGLVKLMKSYGIQGVSLVSLDDVWSAMRFRPINTG